MAYLIKLLIVVAILMIANTIFGIAEADAKGAFDKDVFFSGLRKYGLTYLGIAMMMMVGFILPELTIEWEGVEITINGALRVLSLGASGLYAVKCLGHCMALFGLKREDIERYLPELDTTEDDDIITEEDEVSRG